MAGRQTRKSVQQTDRDRNNKWVFASPRPIVGPGNQPPTGCASSSKELLVRELAATIHQQSDHVSTTSALLEAPSSHHRAIPSSMHTRTTINLSSAAAQYSIITNNTASAPGIFIRRPANGECSARSQHVTLSGTNATQFHHGAHAHVMPTSFTQPVSATPARPGGSIRPPKLVSSSAEVSPRVSAGSVRDRLRRRRAAS